MRTVLSPGRAEVSVAGQRDPVLTVVSCSGIVSGAYSEEEQDQIGRIRGECLPVISGEPIVIG